MRSSQSSKTVLYRGNELVGDLLSAFGDKLKETRLTAALGYLLAGNPEFLPSKLGLRFSTIRSIGIEQRKKDDRTDIQIETDRNLVVIEAKISAQDPGIQTKRYLQTFKVRGLKTIGIALVPFGTALTWEGNLGYLPWNVLVQWLSEKSFKNHLPVAQKFLLGEFMSYVNRHGLVRAKAPKEIYAREINDEESLNLLLKHQLYQCLFQKKSQLDGANYFAPHFGFSIQKLHSGIRQGISYVAKIHAVEVIRNREEYQDAVVRFHGKTYFKKFKSEIMYPVERRGNVMRSLIFVEEARLVFNPPIEKMYLQKGKGFLSKRAYSFDELFKAMHRVSVA